MLKKSRVSSPAICLATIALASLPLFASASTFPSNPNFLNWYIENDTYHTYGYDPFENYGDITISTGGWIINSATTFNNYNYLGIHDAYDSFFMGGNLNNFGTIISAGFLWPEQLTNSGYVLQDGHGDIELIENSGTFSNFGPILNNKDIVNTGIFSNGHFSEIGSGIDRKNGTYTQLSGETINHGEINRTSIDILGGNLSGTGTLNGAVNIGLGATVTPGSSPGQLTINGDLHSNGNYVIEIAGLSSGQFDVLDINGNAFFTGGNFEFDFIDGFLPSVGDHWDFLLADSLSGWETVNVTFAGLGDGLGVDLDSEGGKLTFTVITAVPEPETYAMLLAGLGLLGFFVRNRKQAA